MKHEERVVMTVAMSVDALQKIFTRTIKTGEINELVNNRKDLKELQDILIEGLDDLNNIMTLRKHLKNNNIKP